MPLDSNSRRKTFMDDEHRASEIAKVKKRGNFIVRQELSNLTLECNFTTAITCNIVLFIIFLILGFPIYNSAAQSIEYSFDYTNW
jgi:hypothetical protein